MSYRIEISGHKDTESEEASREFEAEVVRKTREFVQGLEGVGGATVNTGYLGSVNVLAPEEEAGG